MEENPGTNVGAEFPTFYIYKKPLNERQKGNFLEILGNFKCALVKRTKELSSVLKKLPCGLIQKVNWLNMGPMVFLQLSKSSPGLFSHPSTE
jgi:hypothetical protein